MSDELPPAVEILLAEDDPRDAELTMRALRKRGLANAIVHVSDGAEALELLLGAGRRALPRVVLADLKMPKVDGLELLQALRADARTKALPVVMLTSSRQEPDIAKAYELGANSYIVKPVDFDKFQTAVADIGAYWLLLNQARP
jgi:two-component system response regulator